MADWEDGVVPYQPAGTGFQKCGPACGYPPIAGKKKEVVV
jgi:hypothetical protein